MAKPAIQTAAILPRPIPAWSPGVSASDGAWLLLAGRGIVPLEAVEVGVMLTDGEELGEWDGEGSELTFGLRVAVGVEDG